MILVARTKSVEPDWRCIECALETKESAEEEEVEVEVAEIRFCSVSATTETLASHR